MIEEKLQAIIDLLSKLNKPDFWATASSIATIIGLLFAFMEFRRYRKATELSNKQSLFDKRLSCYFANKRILEELDRNWNSLQQIIHAKEKQRGDFINIVFQLFFNTTIANSKFSSNAEIFRLAEIYNEKISEIQIVPDETRILYNFKDVDSGLFASSYISLLYHLFLAKQFYSGSTPKDRRDEEYEELCVSIESLEEIKDEMRTILDRMRDELNLNKEIG